MKRVTLAFMVMSGCHSSAGFLEGVDFHVADAVFERAPAFEGTTSVTKILVSDAADLCDRLAVGGSLAGYSELAIRRWESGSVQVALRKYDDDCRVLETELASQGWVEDQSGGPERTDFDVVFRTEARSVSGRLVASFCPLPDDARIGCAPPDSPKVPQ